MSDGRRIPRAVVFDLFHTLTAPESEWSDLPWTADVLGIDRDRWNELLWRSRWRLTGEERDPQTIIRRLAREADPAIPEERIRQATHIRQRRFLEFLTRIPGENVETLEALRVAGLRLGLISNADAAETAAWSVSPLAGLFDVETFSCEVGWVKPEPAIFHRCLVRLGVAATDCVFVGDGGSNELTAAKSLGMTTVFMSGVIASLWPDQVRERLPICDHHIKRIPEVLDLLGLLPQHP